MDTKNKLQNEKHLDQKQINTVDKETVGKKLLGEIKMQCQILIRLLWNTGSFLLWTRIEQLAQWLGKEDIQPPYLISTNDISL